LAPGEQSAIWAQLPARLAAFGFKTFRLAAGPAVVNEFIGRTFRETTGRWRLVSPNIEAGITIETEARPQVVDAPSYVTATAGDGNWLRLNKHEKVRIFGFANGTQDARMNTVALVLPKGRAQRDLDDGRQVTPNGFFTVDAPDLFTEIMVQQIGRSGEAAKLAADGWEAVRSRLPALLAAGGARLALRNALGELVTSEAKIWDPAPEPDANAPADLKISRAFVAGAVFHADDPDWLAAALAP
jgi:hypothetical protein